ncbi:TetR/AcrR family transcriptional regulator [Luteimicrobium subarcticum]|uniref:TetR family transcriptional regulator n=1 Tax=Luteimicrobium subarcticum TaxID=620910 RepID=A0A2M8WW52_9MICO|nr:TetR/AcrR family transcriptional regulator [Luteimicrobium subarcticum]PJI95154.1 TetR family transcriptional regulator [Luteimicrobium subarcticum]
MTATTTAAPRSARGARTRGEILDAAQQLFVDPGYRATSLRDIASAAGLTHPALRRHFASKDEILLAVVGRFEDENRTTHGRPTDGLWFADIARHNAETPGYLALFSALAGEAAARSHPAHERMKQRYDDLATLSVPLIRAAQARGTVDAGRDASDEALRVAAAWDGLQVLELYLPDRVQVVPALARHERLLADPVGAGALPGTGAGPSSAGGSTPSGLAGHAPFPALELAADDDVPVEGYAKGRERRAQILADATRLFAAEGYGDTSMRDVAERVGVSKSTLFHHYATKEDLLRAVLVARDAQIVDRVGLAAASGARELLESLPDGARANALDEPGLVEVYAVLSCEAVTPDHPAHAYFERRYRRTVASFTAVFEAARADGDLPPHRDPADEAAWLVALWDGLQIRWMYDRSLDVGAHLAAHVTDVLPART